jgi:hypothetical protein
MKNTVENYVKKFIHTVLEQAINEGFAEVSDLQSKIIIKDNALQKELLSLYDYMIATSEIKQKLIEILEKGKSFNFRNLKEKDMLMLLRYNMNNIINKKIRVQKEKSRGRLSKSQKQNKLEENLIKYDFKRRLIEYHRFDETQSEKIIDLLIENKMPFNIALLKEIGVIDAYRNSNKNERDIELGKIFSVNPRRIRGNINVLIKSPNEDINRYTSHLHMESVKKILQEQKIFKRYSFS